MQIKNKINLIVFTWPESYANEMDWLHKMFHKGLKRLHLRKPGFSIEQMSNWLNEVDKAFLDRIVIHSHYELVDAFGLAGCHFTERQRRLEVFEDWQPVSTSFHRLSDWEEQHTNFKYSFISPVFNSISKQNYQASYNVDLLQLRLRKKEKAVYALGGIEKDNLSQAINLGFDGVAVLGAVWLTDNPLSSFERLNKEVEKNVTS